MLEKGVLHPGLRSDDTKNWGATLDGKTVIRRSAAGSPPTARRSSSDQQLHHGARSRARDEAGRRRDRRAARRELSFPRFLVYEAATDTGALTAIGAVKGLLYTPDEYVGHASNRDFFYVTAR